MDLEKSLSPLLLVLYNLFFVKDRIIRAPMSFFDTTPAGRILNRFSKDIDVLESAIPQSLKSFLMTASGVVQVVIVVSIATPFFLLLLIPIAIFYIFLQRFYIPTSRQLKRLEATTRSPVIASFGETLQGTIFSIFCMASIANRLRVIFSSILKCLFLLVVNFINF